jgi:hypothetical protein
VSEFFDDVAAALDEGASMVGVPQFCGGLETAGYQQDAERDGGAVDLRGLVLIVR